MSHNKKIEAIRYWLENNISNEFKSQISSYKSPLTFHLTTTNNLETTIIFESEFINNCSENNIKQRLSEISLIQLFHHNLGKTIRVLENDVRVLGQ